MNTLQMVPACAGRPAVAPQDVGTPAKSLPLADLYSSPRQIQIKTPLLWRGGRDEYDNKLLEGNKQAV